MFNSSAMTNPLSFDNPKPGDNHCRAVPRYVPAVLGRKQHAGSRGHSSEIRPFCHSQIAYRKVHGLSPALPSRIAHTLLAIYDNAYNVLDCLIAFVQAVYCIRQLLCRPGDRAPPQGPERACGFEKP